jgi:hypothetical protein
MKMDAKASRKSLETDGAVLEMDPRELAEPKRIEPGFASESRKAGRSTDPQSLEECVVGIVKTFKRPSLQRDGNRCRIRINPTPFSERLALIDEGAGNSCLAIGADSFLKTCIVELALILENSLERSMLTLGGQDSISVREHHRQ